MPVFSINKTLAAIQLLAQSGTQENAERVAGLIGVQLAIKNAIVEYTTKKGKVIRGVVRTDLSYAEAKAIDEFTFKKDGGWFIREKHLGGMQVKEQEPIAKQEEPLPATTQELQQKDTLHRQGVKLEDVLVEWKAKFGSFPPEYETLKADKRDLVFHITGSIDDLRLRASVRVMGSEPSEFAVAKLKEVIAAQKSGYLKKKVKIKSQVGFIFVKNGIVLTENGVKKLVEIGGDGFQPPEMIDGAGYSNGAIRQIRLAKEFSKWIAAYGDTDNLGTIVSRLVETGVSDIYKIERLTYDKNSLALRYFDKKNNASGFSMQIIASGDWQELRDYILHLAKINPEMMSENELYKAVNSHQSQVKDDTEAPPVNTVAQGEAEPSYSSEDATPIDTPKEPTPIVNESDLIVNPVTGITHDSENSPRSPYDKLTPAFAAKPNQVADIVYEAKEAKKILIDTLKKAFPSVLFNVKKSYHGRNGDYTVSWLDGASETLVKRVLSHFVGYQQGAMDVSMDFRLHGKYLIAKNEDGETVSYGFRELETHRKTSSKFLKGVLSQFSEGKDGEYSVAINNEVFKKYGFNSGSDLYKVVDNGEEGQLLAKDYYGNWRGATHDLIDQFSTAKYNSHTTAAKNRGSNVSSSSNPLESDSNTGSRPDTQSSIENSNANESGELGRMARPSIDRPNEGGGVQRDSSVGLSENDGIGIGTASDSIVSDGSGQRGVGERDNARDGGGSDSVNEPRSPVVAKRDAAVVRATTRDTSSDDIKLKEQLEAEGVATKWGDADNINKALPYLLPEQRDDVAKAEKRLIDDNKNGMLFTNGTGTGKTFTGLGAVKRFANAGKKNILIVSMNDKIIRDFVKSALSLNLDIHQLDGVTDNGKDKIVATTYANLAQNLMLGKRDWDLIVVDEAHNLMQGEKGENTNALAKLRALSGHHAGFNEWVKMRHAEKDPKPIGENPETGEPIYDQDEVAAWEAFKKPLREQWKKTWAEQPKGRTKVIFLTATPFSYVKTLDWAEGYLFDFVPPAKKFSNDTEAMGAAYNSGSEYERFYMSNFGYKMRTNRLTRPDGRVDVGILERKFAEKLKTEGAMSGRDLSVPFDYDRKFVLIDSKIGEKIDEGFKFLWSEKDKDGQRKYGELLTALNRQFDYLSRIQLLEAIKADAAIDQIKKHIALGRKVIVFHDYNVGGGTNPFVLLGGGADEKAAAQYESFKSARPDLIGLDLDLDAPITALKRVFSDALLFNGTVSKGQRSKNADLFNSDNNGHNLLIAQSDAAATGISLHDTTGTHQRVIINIGMPAKPAKLRQTEGRIYRVGQASNAIQRYLTTGTDWERSAFAQKIAERAETVDNLAQGESAVVSIKDALVRAYESAEHFDPSPDDGIGGKAYDAENSRVNALSAFDRAKTDYWVKQKVTAKRQDREGKEWYATPEPVGLFMVNLSGAHSGDDILEPSAGDGAIGRYMPSDASVTFIEPSESLASRARMNNTNANVIVDGFENHGSNNKYDAIVMNPPFGQGGSIAIKHLVKAFEHLRDGGRVVALLPVGKMDELIVKYHEMGYFKDIYTVAEFALPSSTFKNAGTGVNTKIHVFERHNFKGDAPQGIISKNLSHYDNIEDLFGAIENINIKPRKPRIDEALAEYGLEIYPERSKYIITGEGLKRKDITTTLFGTFGEKNKDGDYVEKYNRSTAFLKWLKDSQIPNMAQFNNGLSFNNLPIKYQQKTNKYNTWDGVGSMPDWLKGFISYNGAKLEDFAVEKPVFDSLSSGVSLMETLALITSLSKKKDDAVAQQLADAIGVKIKKPSPIFETYKDALDWISEQSKKYASEKAFKSTDLYKSVYEQVNLLYEQENLLYKQEKAKISAAKIKQMRDAGIDVGDKVKAFVMGSFLNGQTHYGVVVLRDGYPYVKLNEKVTVSSKGKLRDTSFVAWNDRWVKDAPTNTASQTKTITVKVPVSSNTLATYTAGAWGNLSLLSENDFLKTWQYVNAANYMLRNSIDPTDSKTGNRHILSQSGKPELVKLVNDEFTKRGLDQKYSLFVERKEKPQYDDIGDFNSATSNTSIMDTLDAIMALAKNNSQANADKLAKLLGVKLAPKQELDMFGDPIQSQGFDLFGEPIQDGDDSPVEELPRLAIQELPLNKLTLSEDVPQFKSGVEDSDTGVVEALGGKFDRTGVAPIQVWERADGRLEIISGRHRTDLARRSGEKTIPAQVHKESEGFTAKQAMMLDAELNIRDGQGKVKDYVDYFSHSEISEDEADKRGLLARSIGQRAFMIASKGSEELLTLHRNDIISDQAAADIANIAPNNSAMQAVGLRVLQEHKPLNNALNTIRAVMALTREKGQEPDTFDLFGFDDSALKEAEAMAKVASRKQRQIAEQLTAIKGAVKNPKLAAKHGVIVENEADAIAKVQTMTAQKARWDNWSSHADLLAEVRSELNNKLDSIFDEDEYYWLCQEELDLIAA